MRADDIRDRHTGLSLQALSRRTHRHDRQRANYGLYGLRARRLKIGSLFSGIGGLDIGLERAGLGRVVWQVERDAFCREVLAQHWPNAIRFDDVQTVGANELCPVDVVCGGFPCQDLSLAGKGRGLDGSRSGLWFEFERIICEIRPRYVVVENVPALRFRGLDRVLGSLAHLGYDARWGMLSAKDVGAPHLRERLFVVAHSKRPTVQLQRKRGSLGQEKGGVEAEKMQRQRSGADVEHRNPTRLKKRALSRAHIARMGRSFDGLPSGLDWPVGRGEEQAPHEPPRTWTRKPDDIKRLSALGNAVVPQVAFVVGMHLRKLVEASESR